MFKKRFGNDLPGARVSAAVLNAAVKLEQVGTPPGSVFEPDGLDAISTRLCGTAKNGCEKSRLAFLPAGG